MLKTGHCITKKRIVLALAVLCLSSDAYFHFQLSAQESVSTLNWDELQIAEKASNDLVRLEAAKAALFVALLAKETGRVVEISPEVRNKYVLALKSVVAPIPVTIGGVVTFFLSQSSFEGSIAEVFKAIVKAMGESSTASVESLRSLRPSFESLDTLWNAVWQVIEPSARSVFNKTVGVSFLAISAAALTSGSLYLTLNTPESALEDHEIIRKILGYSGQVDRELDELLKSLKVVYRIDEGDSQRLKALLKEELMKQAVEKKFDPRAEYRVDIIEIMRREKIITASFAETADLFVELIRIAQEKKIDLREQAGLRQNLNTLALLGAFTEEYIRSGDLDAKQATEAKAILVDLESTFAAVRANFR